MKFVTADKIYANSNLNVKREFRTDVIQLGGEIENVDFSEGETAAGKINKWVRDQTAGKIEKIVDSGSLNDQTSLFVVNTIYFKGLWKNPFRFKNTKKRPFSLDEKQNVDVDTMYQENEFHYGFLNDPDADAKVINLPYQVNKSYQNLLHLFYSVERQTNSFFCSF